MSQLLAADRAAWSRLIETNTKPRPDAAGVLALDKELLEALKSYEVAFTLLPTASKQPAKPQASASSSPPKQQPGPFGKAGRKGNNRFRPYNAKGKGKTKTKFDQRVPREIREVGGTTSTPSGDPICFDYSLKKCKENVVDGRCRKGFHVCAICYGHHCMADHKKS